MYTIFRKSLFVVNIHLLIHSTCVIIKSELNILQLLEIAFLVTQ